MLLKKAYNYFRWLSLDVVMGAIFFLRFIEVQYSTGVPLSVYIALAGAIYCIYSLDHLLDIQGAEIYTLRRKFHFQLKGIILSSVIIVGILAIYESFKLPSDVITNGAILSVFCGLYLAAAFKWRQLIIKEVLVALGYAFGIFLGPFSLLSHWHFTDSFLIGQLAILALLNLIILSYYDQQSDEKEGFKSIFTALSQKGFYITLALLSCLLVCIGVCVLFADFAGYLKFEMLYVSMLIGLLLIPIFASKFSYNDRYRAWGDAVFYFPLLFLW